MKNVRILIVVGTILSSSVVFGQDYTFKVLANKGTNEVRTGGSWQAVKTGASLKSGDELRISENAYLGLVHATGKPLEVKQPGNYSVADLAARVDNGGTSVLNKYTDFILSSNSAEAKKNRLSATGAVHRGSAGDIKVYLPKNQYSGIYNNLAIIKWDSKVSGPFVVTFKNMFDDELMKMETPETKIQIDLNDAKLANESAILVEVHVKADTKSKSEMHLIKRLSPSEQAKIKTDLTTITGEVQEETALNKLILAGFYEQNMLLIDAMAAYEQAIKIAPDVPSFTEDYDEFLLRNELKVQE